MHDGKTASLLARCLKVLCFDLKVILADAGYRGSSIEMLTRKYLGGNATKLAYGMIVVCHPHMPICF